MAPDTIPRDQLEAWRHARGTPVFPVMSFPLSACPSPALAAEIVRARAYLGAGWVEGADFVSDGAASFYVEAAHVTDAEAFYAADEWTPGELAEQMVTEAAHAEQRALTSLYAAIARAVALLIDYHCGEVTHAALNQCAAELQDVARDRTQRVAMQRAADQRARASRAHTSQPSDPGARSARAKAGAARRPAGKWELIVLEYYTQTPGARESVEDFVGDRCPDDPDVTAFHRAERRLRLTGKLPGGNHPR